MLGLSVCEWFAPVFDLVPERLGDLAFDHDDDKSFRAMGNHEEIVLGRPFRSIEVYLVLWDGQEQLKFSQR